jgi:GT2 family glycosyltransferase
MSELQVSHANELLEIGSAHGRRIDDERRNFDDLEKKHLELSQRMSELEVSHARELLEIGSAHGRRIDDERRNFDDLEKKHLELSQKMSELEVSHANELLEIGSAHGRRIDDERRNFDDLEKKHLELSQRMSELQVSHANELLEIGSAHGRRIDDERRNFDNLENKYVAQLAQARRAAEDAPRAIADRERLRARELQTRDELHATQLEAQSTLFAGIAEGYREQLTRAQQASDNALCEIAQRERDHSEKLLNLFDRYEANTAESEKRWLDQLATLGRDHEAEIDKVEGERALLEIELGQTREAMDQERFYAQYLESELEGRRRSAAWRMTMLFRHPKPSKIQPPTTVQRSNVSPGPDVSAPSSLARYPHDIANTIEDLLSCEDEAFVWGAYKLLLRRDPDVQGRRYYLASVRAGIDRREILRQIRLSPEAISINASLAGLDEEIYESQLKRRPLMRIWRRMLGQRPTNVASRETALQKLMELSGLQIRKLSGIRFNGDIATFDHDPQLHVELTQAFGREATRAVIELEIQSVDGQVLDPKLYLGPSENQAILPRVHSGVYTFLLSFPTYFHSFRLDPNTGRGRARITRLALRPIEAFELAAMCASDKDHAGPAELLHDIDSDVLWDIALSETMRLNRLRPYEGGAVESVEHGRIGGVVMDREVSPPPVVQPTVTDYGLNPAAQPKTPIDFRRERICADIEDRLVRGGPQADLAGPLVSILTPVYNVKDIWLRRMIDSVTRQTYRNWELCLVDDGSTDASVRSVLAEVADSDERIRILFRGANGGISAATNDALSMARGQYVALVDNDDMLTCDALEAMVEAIVRDDFPDWLYSDEFKIDEQDRASALFAKPDWSPYMLLNYMYTGHLSLYLTETVRNLGGFRTMFDFSQDYDLALRVSEEPCRVTHVEKYLYGWRMIAGSGAHGDKPNARLSNIAALQDAIYRRGWKGKSVPLPTANRVVFDRNDLQAKCSIVVPSDNAENIQNSIDSILKTSTYGNFEIIVVTNSMVITDLRSREENESVIWQAYDKPFNFSDKCNCGASIATGEFIIFYNDDVRVVSPNWMESLLEYLALPGIGAIGPKLLYENGTIQHAGMVTGVRRLVGTAFHAYPGDTAIHFNMAQCVREVSLICGALLAMPAKLFRELGGWDSVNTPISHSDVDLCLRIREAGYSCIYTPYATLVHIGHVSLAQEDAMARVTTNREKQKHDIYILKRFGSLVRRDPFFPKAMRDLVYIDSQEEFIIGPAAGQARGRPDVLIVSHELTNSGAPRVVFDMAHALIELGSFVVVTAPSDGPMRSKLEALGVQVIIDETLFLGQPWIKEFGRTFDKVIVNTIIGWPTVQQLQDEVQTYWYIHEAALIDHIADSQPAFKAFLPQGRNILAVSGRTGEYLSKHEASFQTLQTGVHDIGASFPPQNMQNTKVKFGLFGGLESRKGQDIAAEGFRLLPDKLRQSAELHFFGRTLDASFEESVRNSCRGYPNIYFNGEAKHPEYFSRLLEMDVIVLPSRDDPFPLVALDAMSCSKTILCSHTTGTSWHIVHGKSGYIAYENNAADLCELFAMLISDAAARHVVRVGAREVFESLFTIDAFRTRFYGAIGLSVEASHFATNAA